METEELISEKDIPEPEEFKNNFIKMKTARDVFRHKKVRLSKGAYLFLNKAAEDLVDKAIERAYKNKRRTIYSFDF